MTLSEACMKVSLFKGLREEDLAPFEAGLRFLKIPNGLKIIAEDDDANTLYYIVSGKVQIHKSLKSPEVPYAELTCLEEGELFGEMAILDNSPRSASVVADGDVELLSIQKDTFVQMAFQHPVIMFNLMRTLSDRLRSTNVRFVDLMDEMISKNRLMNIGMAVNRIIHDIKTPLTVIVLTAQLIENLNPETAEFCQNIVKQSRLVDAMVREILDFARGVETSPAIQKVDMVSFFDEIFEMYESSLSERGIKLTLDNKVTEPVYFDINMMRRVIMNLIKNASEAMTEAGEIAIIISKSAGWLQMSVKDDGPGVPENIRENIFQPFVTEQKDHGSGLGLPICRKLVMEHKGRLEYIPLEKGSRFDVRIPQTMQ